MLWFFYRVFVLLTISWYRRVIVGSYYMDECDVLGASLHAKVATSIGTVISLLKYASLLCDRTYNEYLTWNSWYVEEGDKEDKQRGNFWSAMMNMGTLPHGKEGSTLRTGLHRPMPHLSSHLISLAYSSFPSHSRPSSPPCPIPCLEVLVFFHGGKPDSRYLIIEKLQKTS